jgi:ATP-dependent DNA helicase UvrD/PcrA
MDDSFDIANFESPSTPIPMDTSYLNGLNEGQRAAVDAVDGPVLVLAGAGTGKTRVLITRLAHILNTRPVNPWEILAVTFTNKAAQEMRERTAGIIGPRAIDLKLGTFHSIGVWLLRRHAELAGLGTNYTILDTDDQLRLLKQILTNEGIDIKKWPPRGLASVIDRWKDKGLRPEQVSKEGGEGFAHGRAAALYQIYQDRLKSLNACDFGDLLLHPLHIFQQNPDILAKYQNQFKYILVDEYQDTNVAQYLLLRLLAQKHKNICCVGDDDQSIYGWRGAEVGNILRFESDFPGAAVVRLERNYRSTAHILGAASGLIDKNEDRLGKTLWTEDNDGERVLLRGIWDGPAEARWVAEEIASHHRNKSNLSDMAILVRASFQTRDFEEVFLSEGINYQVIGGLRFYERAVIRDILAYLRVTNQPNDDLAFARIYNLPKRGLGAKALETLQKIARNFDLSLAGAAEYAIEHSLFKGKPLKALADLMENFGNWRQQKDFVTPSELVELVLDESGYLQMWKDDKTTEAEGKVENLKELVEALNDYAELGDFLEHVALVAENNQNSDSDMVSIMTLHAAKGLEYDIVFLPGWEEGLFPHQRALDENGLKALEEERRLAYVGITRARKNCYISHASSRRIHGQWQNSLPSRFVGELPSEHITEQGDVGVYSRRNAEEDHSNTWSVRNSNHLSKILEKRAAQNDRMTNNQTAPVNDGNTGIQVGHRVFHQKFGYGRVLSKDASKLKIAFDKAGTKKVMENFVEPT